MLCISRLLPWFISSHCGFTAIIWKTFRKSYLVERPVFTLSINNKAGTNKILTGLVTSGHCTTIVDRESPYEWGQVIALRSTHWDLDIFVYLKSFDSDILLLKSFTLELRLYQQ